jgi:hypothetical protein
MLQHSAKGGSQIKGPLVSSPLKQEDQTKGVQNQFQSSKLQESPQIIPIVSSSKLQESPQIIPRVSNTKLQESPQLKDQQVPHVTSPQIPIISSSKLQESPQLKDQQVPRVTSPNLQSQNQDQSIPRVTSPNLQDQNQLHRREGNFFILLFLFFILIYLC